MNPLTRYFDSFDAFPPARSLSVDSQEKKVASFALEWIARHFQASGKKEPAYKRHRPPPIQTDESEAVPQVFKLTESYTIPGHIQLSPRRGRSRIFPNKTPPAQMRCFSEEVLKSLDEALKLTAKELAKGEVPTCLMRNPKGKSGSYVFLDPATKKEMLVFKASENERGTPLDRAVSLHAPGGAMPIKDGIAPGESAVMEVIAYRYISFLLERLGIGPDKMFVPPTAIACCSSSYFFIPEREGDLVRPTAKTGALQLWQEGCAPFTGEVFTKETAIAIALIDFLLLNTDRHRGNLLVKGNQIVLIDHGCCLPRNGMAGGQFGWKEALQPFLEEPTDRKTVQFIYRLTIDWLKDVIADMSRQGILDVAEFSHRRARAHLAAVLLLKEGIKQGLSLYEIVVLAENTGKAGHPNNAIHAICAEEKKIVEMILLYKEALLRLKQEGVLSLDALCKEAKKTCCTVL